VVIPCYNQASFLAEAVASALEQSYPDKEVIVVNDGSPDEAAQVAASFGDAIIYVEQPNKGLSGARNTGIKASRGDLIAFLDSDDAYLPDALKTQADYLATHGEIAFVCGDAALFDGDKDIGLKSGLSGGPAHPQNFRWDTVEYCATPSTVMLRRSCFDRAGFFDETLKNAAEDWLMWVQLARQFEMAYIDKPLVRYRVHGANATRNVERINTGNRYAVAKVIDSAEFSDYPAGFRARLLFYRFAAAWRFEGKASAARYFARGFLTHPGQLPYGLRVARQGLANTVRRWHEKD
jgi:glycosyltransferase involved in cell wall biosynthesis